MKILILGGTRFLGYFITHRLLKDGHTVTLFNRGKTPDHFDDRVNHIHGERNDHASFVKRFRGKRFDVVLDMIAYQKADSQSAVEAFSRNIGHFIHISTGAVYLVTKNYPSPLKEEDFDRPLYIHPEKKDEWWSYGYHKRGCEEVLRKAHSEMSFPVTIIRPPIIIGERDYTLRAYSYFIRILDEKPMILPDGGLNPFTLAYQGDIVQTIAENLQNPVAFGQAYNLAQKEIFSTKSFIQKAASILKKVPEFVDIPSDKLKRTPLKTSFSPYFSRRPFILDIGKAQKDLNYSPTSSDIWMQKTIRWFLENYNGPFPDNYALRDREVAFARKY